MRNINIQLFGFYPFNPLLGQKMQTNAKGVEVDAAYTAHYNVSAANAVAASDIGVHAAIALTNAIQAIIIGITNPAIPRSIRIKGNAAGIAGNVTITGTNYNDDVITEVIALNGATAVEGNKAFKTVTKIDLPIETHAGTDTVSVGWGDKLGLPYLLSMNTVLVTFLNGVKEGTAPTVTVHSANLESNTIDLNSALNGSAVDVFLLV